MEGRVSRRSSSRIKSRFLFTLLFCLFSFAGLIHAERTISEKSVGPGCTFTRFLDNDVPLGIYVLKVDLNNEAIELESVLAVDAQPGKETVLAMSQRYEQPHQRVVGAINADYFYQSVPFGIVVQDGRFLQTGRRWSSIAFSADKVPQIAVFSPSFVLETVEGIRMTFTSFNRIRNDSNVVLYSDVHGPATTDRTDGRAFLLDPNRAFVPTHGSLDINVKEESPLLRQNIIPEGMWVLSIGEKWFESFSEIDPGDELKFHVLLTPDLIKVDEAVSGGPRILRGGEISVAIQEEGQRTGFDKERHPRTAIGYTQDRRFLIMVVVDGRQPGYSRGVDLYELAAMMKEFGCYEAMNLDGGGSSTMVIGNSIVNRPSDAEGPRPVANALLILDNSQNR